MREPFEVPDEVITDFETGLALNIPASLQEYPNWWIADPDRYAILLMKRKQAGIEIEDFPKGTERVVKPLKIIPMGSN